MAGGLTYIVGGQKVVHRDGRKGSKGVGSCGEQGRSKIGVERKSRRSKDRGGKKIKAPY